MSAVYSRRARRLRQQVFELKRRLTRQPHTVIVFVELDDPYSYLLCHYLPELEAHFDIRLELRVTEAFKGPFRPEPELYAEYAVTDCRRVAAELGIPFLDRGTTPPVEHRVGLIDALAAATDSVDFNDDVVAAITAYWRGDSEAAARRSGNRVSVLSGVEMIEANRRLLESLGHYNSAMMYYGGEWYWGIDRLHYLVDRLKGLGAMNDEDMPSRIAAIAQTMQVRLPVRPPSAARELPPLELFYSLRSPYSWLALAQTYEIADAFGIDLHVRPVMPMVMRGMQMPMAKLRYVAADTVREAKRRNVPFGRFADPIGPGVMRCLAVLYYAFSEKRAREFLFAAGEAIWARGIDVATDKGLRKVTAKAGLFWPDAHKAVDDDSWLANVEDNRAAMIDAGSWGVPTMRIGEFVTWGQDRDWLLVRHLEECCDSGDGILV